MPERKTPHPAPRYLRRRIFHQPLGGLQSSHAIAIPVTLARLHTVLVVLSPQRVAGLALERLLDNQPARQLDQFVLR